MHGFYEQLLNDRQFNGLLVAALTLHTCRDATDDDDGIGALHLIGQFCEVDELALADVAAQHGELSAVVAVLYADVVGLASLHGERLVLHTATEAEAAASARLAFFHHLAVNLQDIAVVSGQCVFHFTRERRLILSADAHGECVAAHTVGKAPGTEGREVQFLVVAFGHRFTAHVSVVPELYQHALTVVEVEQVRHSLVFVVQLACLLVDDVGIGHCLADALQQRVLMGLCRRAAIVAVQQLHIIGVRAEHSQRLDVFRQGKNGSLSSIVKQHHRLAGSLYGKIVVLLAADDVFAKVGPRQHVGGVEHAEFEAARQRLAQVTVEVSLLDKALLQAVGETHEHLAALQVSAVEHCVDRGRQRVFVRLVLSTVEEVVDGVAIGEDDGVVAPLVAQDVDEQAVAAAAGLAFKALIGAHHLAHVGFLHQCLKGWQIRLPEVAVGRFDVHRVAQRLRTAVHGIVLGAGMSLIILVVVTLHAFDCCYAQNGVHIRVFATGLLSPTPARIAEDVDIRAPERELRIAGIVNGTHVHMLYAVVGAVPVGTSLVADLREDIVDQLLAEGCSHADGLRIDGIVALTHTVACLAPPVV